MFRSILRTVWFPVLISLFACEEDVRYKFITYLPDEYTAQNSWSPDRQDQFPLILFLHGGPPPADLNALANLGLPRILKNDRHFPFVVVSPLFKNGESWFRESLDALLDRVVKEYRVDKERIYVTGLSLGGTATWSLAMAYPDRFAAIAPVAGVGDPRRMCKVVDVPVWAFHNDGDPVVPFSAAEMSIELLRDCGGDPIFTVYNSGLHDAWTAAYNNQDLYDWFLTHTRP